MKLGIIAGNRLLPIILAKNIKENSLASETIAFCFKGETSSCISKYVDRVHWIDIGKLGVLREELRKKGIKDCIMVGQITPLRIFRRKNWDAELSLLVEKAEDMRPHTIFSHIIQHLEKEGINFLDSTLYLKKYLAQAGLMNNVRLDNNIIKDIDFGVRMISRFVDLDIGQTAVIKNRSVVAIESLEGTDNTIKRGHRLAGKKCVVLKFSKANQDLRFDVPVVGLATLKLLEKIKAAALVLEADKVIIIEKERFLLLADKWQIPIIGRAKA
ncbi:MAG: UDP-2,3-diacylglucosamine diphosphatase LpxI [Candidatus Omnitrophota bacterium]|nr:UDP-2,3-diacylglucosamine diphosphatase LpxI [Candidatus Omnitrophota bacterium]